MLTTMTKKHTLQCSFAFKGLLDKCYNHVINYNDKYTRASLPLQFNPCYNNVIIHLYCDLIVLIIKY